MSIEHIQVLGISRGTRIVPKLADYDEASADWEEAEYRASVPGETIVGAWEGAGGHVRMDDWPYTEVCVIRSGSIEIVDDTGASRRFGAGDSFVIPKGFSGVWRTVEPCQKVFVGIPSA